MDPVRRLIADVFAASSSGNDSVDIVDAVGNAHDNIVLALIGVLSVVVTALVYVVKAYGASKTAAEQSTQANEAVNHKDHGETRIFEQVRTIGHKVDELLKVQDKHQALWDDHLSKWGRLPPDLDDETDLVIAIREVRSAISEVRDELTAHVKWEMEQKYPH